MQQSYSFKYDSLIMLFKVPQMKTNLSKTWYTMDVNILLYLAQLSIWTKVVLSVVQIQVENQVL